MLLSSKAGTWQNIASRSNVASFAVGGEFSESKQMPFDCNVTPVVEKSGKRTDINSAFWLSTVTLTIVRKSANAAAIAGSPYTTACSPKMIILPGADAQNDFFISDIFCAVID